MDNISEERVDEIKEYVVQEKKSLHHDLETQFPESKLDIQEEEKFVSQFFGTSDLAKVFFVFPSHVEELSEKLGKYGIQNLLKIGAAGFYNEGNHVVIILREQERFGQFEEFESKRRTVHELSHSARMGSMHFSRMGEHFNPGDFLVSVVKKGEEKRIDIRKPRIGFTLDPVPLPSTRSTGSFLEEAIAEFTAAQWANEQLKQGKYSNVAEGIKNIAGDFNPHSPSKTRIIIAHPSDPGYAIKVPVTYLSFAEDGKTTLSPSTFAALGLSRILAKDPTLFPFIIQAKTGDLTALREVPRRINSLLGSDAYAYLQGSVHTPESMNSFYTERFNFINQRLQEK